MSSAYEVMRRYNPNALIGKERPDQICMIEDVLDPDGRMYRIEIQSDLSGEKAIAFCRHNPWGRNPYGYSTSHLNSNGLICLGSGAHSDVNLSQINLRTAIPRARYWCTGFSVLLETGTFPNL